MLNVSSEVDPLTIGESGGCELAGRSLGDEVRLTDLGPLVRLSEFHLVLDLTTEDRDEQRLSLADDDLLRGLLDSVTVS